MAVPGGWGGGLSKRGLAIEFVEPNGFYNTGTGYLESRDDADFKIWNDLDAWYASSQQYDFIVTRNCVHHFKGLSHVAACLRSKLRPGGQWIMFHEWFAEDARSAYKRLKDHPYSQKYSLFEFPYPVSHYVDALVFVGFRLKVVVPRGYAGGALEATETRPSRTNLLLSRAFLKAIEWRPALSVGAYRAERLAASAGRRLHFFSRPGALVFQREEL